MHSAFRLSPLLAVLLLAGCSMGPTQEASLGPTLAQPNPSLASPDQTAVATASTTQVVAQTPATGVSIADVGTYVDAGALALLSAKDKQEAASAQFNALTFGRPAAPRSWQGDTGATGQIVVGPYVRVNDIDCRDFTNTVTISGKPYVKKGTACRNPDGGWSVVG